VVIYRFYILASNAAFKGSATRLDCLDDAAAIKQAEQMVGGHFVELWQDERRLGRFSTRLEAFRPKPVAARPA
jgi:hypothetical protein